MSKNYKGGYKLIDLQKIDFNDDGDKVKGIYHSIEASYSKALLLTGIVIAGVEKNDVYVKELKVIDGNFHFEAYGYEIIVHDDDNVDFIEIPQPTIRSITSSAVEYNVTDLNDGDEVLLSSTNEDATRFILPSECYLVSPAAISENIIDAFENHVITDASIDTSISVKNSYEVYIKRVGHMILISDAGNER